MTEARKQYGVATASINGVMSAADKSKLDGIASGATANTGTVTSVNAALPTSLFSASSGAVTTTGTLTFTLIAVAAGKVFAGPASGGDAPPTMRALVAGDIPTLNQNTTGSAGTLSPGRTINGTAFDGSADITITAAAGTLSGSTLAAGVTASSLTSFGSSPTLSGTPTATTASGGTNTTQIATTAFVTSAVATAISSAFIFQGSIDASSNPNYPAATKGWLYVINVAGKIGGASGASVDVGDFAIAIADNAGGTQASVGASWTIIEHNLAGALLAANNLSEVDPTAARANINAETAGAAAAALAAAIAKDRLLLPAKEFIVAPPGSPTTGDRYLLLAVLGSPTGAWAGHTNAVAEWSGSGWTFTTPALGMLIFVIATSEWMKWSGTEWELAFYTATQTITVASNYADAAESAAQSYTNTAVAANSTADQAYADTAAASAADVVANGAKLANWYVKYFAGSTLTDATASAVVNETGPLLPIPAEVISFTASTAISITGKVPTTVKSMIFASLTTMPDFSEAVALITLALDGSPFAFNTTLNLSASSDLARPSLSGQFSASGCGLTALEVSPSAAIGSIDVSNNLLTSLSANLIAALAAGPNESPSYASYFNFNNNDLDEASVNALILAIVAGMPLEDVTLDLAGGTNAPPTGAALAAADAWPGGYGTGSGQINVNT